MKSPLSVLVDDRPHPFRVWARQGLPEEFPLIPVSDGDWRRALAACDSPYVTILPGASRVDSGFLHQAILRLDAQPEVNVLMGHSIIRSDRSPADLLQEIDTLSATRYLDPRNVAQEFVLAAAPLLYDWQGLVFRREALLSPAMEAAWSRPRPVWPLLMALSLRSGLCLDARRVAVQLRSQENLTENALLSDLPALLMDIAADARAAGHPEVTRQWAEGVMQRVIDAAVSQSNQRMREARNLLRAVDGDTAAGKFWLAVSGLSRRAMEARLRRRAGRWMDQWRTS